MKYLIILWLLSFPALADECGADLGPQLAAEQAYYRLHPELIPDYDLSSQLAALQAFYRAHPEILIPDTPAPSCGF